MRDGAGGEEKKDTSEDMGTMYDCRKCMYNVQWNESMHYP